MGAVQHEESLKLHNRFVVSTVNHSEEESSTNMAKKNSNTAAKSNTATAPAKPAKPAKPGKSSGEPSATDADASTIAIAPRAYTVDEVKIAGIDTKLDEADPLYDPRIHLPVPEAMIRSIMEDGIRQSIELTPRGGDLFIVEGRFRIRGGREAQKRMRTTDWVDSRGVKHAPNPAAIVYALGTAVTGTNADLFTRAVSANALRVNEGAIGEARKSAIMAKPVADGGYGISDEAIMAAFGWSVGTLRNRRKLLKLPAKLQRDVEIGKITWLQALDIAKKPEEEQAAATDAAADANEEGGHSGARAARAATKGEDAAEQHGKRWLRAILSSDAAVNLDEGAARAFRFLLGEETPLGPAIGATAIKGLTACEKELEAKRRTALVKKNEEARQKQIDKAKKRDADKVAKGGKPAKQPPTNKADAPTPPTPAPKRRKGTQAAAPADAV